MGGGGGLAVLALPVKLARTLDLVLGVRAPIALSS